MADAAPPAERQSAERALEYAPSALERYLLPGCLFTVGGFFGGGMMAVAVAKLVGSLRGCKPADGLPACDHFTYLVVGAVAGMLLLPSVSLWRMRRSAAGPRAGSPPPPNERSL